MEPLARRPCTPISARLVLGLAIMAWGVLLTLDNFGVLEAARYWRLWPLILVAVGAVRLVESARTGGSLFALSGGLLTFVGLALLLSNFEVLRLRQIWPLIVLAVGASIVWKTLVAPRADAAAEPGAGSWGWPRGAASPAGGAANRLEAFTFMGGVNRRSNSQAFTGGTAVAVMGGCEVDLRHVTLADGRAVFDTFAMWGGVEITVPEDWAVESHVVPLLGGFEDKTRQPPDAKQRLIVTGVAIMGGVAVKN
jgi:predicted membrane protein